MKYIIILLMVMTSGLFVTPALAYTMPGQGTDNATDIILWHGDTANISITSANMTIVSLETALTAAGEAQAQVIADNQTVIADKYILLLLVALFTALLFWQKNAFLYLVGSVVLMAYGLSFAADNTVMSASWIVGMMIAVVGTYLLYRVAANELLPLLRRKK